MDTPTPLPFTLEAEGTHGKVTVAGQDVSNLVRSGSVVFGNGDLPGIELHLIPRAGRIEAEGIVTVHTGYDDPEARDSFYAMTASVIRSGLDPSELRQRVDARLVSMADDPLAATCAAIADMFLELVGRDEGP